jgi:hypothetical protein
LPRNKFSEPETGANPLSHCRHFLHRSKRGKGAFCCASPFTVQPDLSLFLRQKCAHPNMLLNIMKEKESIRRFAFCWRKLQKVQGEKIDNLDSACTLAIMGSVDAILKGTLGPREK